MRLVLVLFGRRCDKCRHLIRVVLLQIIALEKPHQVPQEPLFIQVLVRHHDYFGRLDLLDYHGNYYGRLAIPSVDLEVVRILPLNCLLDFSDFLFLVLEAVASEVDGSL